jgi:hypothetical protein
MEHPQTIRETVDCLEGPGRRDGSTLAPIRLGVGLRTGASIGYMHYTRQKTLPPPLTGRLRTQNPCLTLISDKPGSDTDFRESMPRTGPSTRGPEKRV